MITNITQLTRFSKSKIEVVNLEDVREKKINKKERKSNEYNKCIFYCCNINCYIS